MTNLQPSPAMDDCICPVCGKKQQSTTKLLICVDCYLTPAMFAMMRCGLIESGAGFLNGKSDD